MYWNCKEKVDGSRVGFNADLGHEVELFQRRTLTFCSLTLNVLFVLSLFSQLFPDIRHDQSNARISPRAETFDDK